MQLSEAEFAEALAALAWQVELGADEAIGDVPVDRMAVAAAQKPVEPATAPAPDHGDPADQAARGAREIAAACKSLDELQAAVEAFDGCALKRGAKNTVFSDGSAAARVMIVGEAPGREEDIQGKPFVGRSGQLLDRMLDAIGLARHAEDAGRAVYITNVLPWRPPQNRDPSSDETQMMRAFLIRHIELAQPEFLLLMGNAAVKTVLETSTGITRLRGKWAEVDGIPALPMFHPAALLRNPALKKLAWQDLLSLRARLNGEVHGQTR